MGIALQALLTRLASSHWLSSHCAVGCCCLLLLNRNGSRALGTHWSRASERVATARAADVDHAGRSQLGRDLWGDLLDIVSAVSMCH
jgi:hypothetical protein